jgi:CheY-like chemotaxis protein
MPIILMTGYDQLEDPKKLEALGIQTVLLKPFRKGVLGETIRKILKKGETNPLDDTAKSETVNKGI